ncbi:hypothetical protein PoMZ_12716 [Pyricularia oryzae]|uniref:Uncharacterized protein n=1 Tax=Pyricularia oryzae TaxID=318829 RepID=A0A4P7NTJ1_PYROR|nr:hypothetical protein PoMZ_12716 [Pyricularia oryzae]
MHLPINLALVLAAASALAQSVCPTVTRTELASTCTTRRCNSDCSLVTTVQNPCGCPWSVPTATLVAPCQADCPYNGCAVEFRTLNQPCQPTSSTSTRRTTTTTTRWPIVTISITQLPTQPPVMTPCPTITLRTQPADCPIIRCPVPNCVTQTQLRLPCGCSQPRTLLSVDGCQSDCPGGCMTRTQTVSQACEAP